MRVDATNREITCKVVYYGPGMSGKTTNLKQLHDRAPARSVGDLVTLDTHSERTLHFDLLPMDLGTVNGHHIRFEFYTVPGQSYYASTRKLVLDGADAVVFVADSRREALDENIDSMNDLLDNLRHLGLGDDLPVVMQYNKQDLPSALKPEQLEPLLNSRRWPAINAIATSGVGVLETMKAAAGKVIERIKNSTATGGSGAAAVLPAPPAASRPQTWLISCFRCQNMLEISNAKVGDLYTCGACRTTLEIADLDRGLTRAPSAQQPVAAIPPPPPSRHQIPVRNEDSGGYSLQPLESPASAALNIGSGAQVIQADPSLGATFDLEGFEQVALLDETIAGRRLRVRNRSDGTRYRAMVISPNLMRQPGYAAQVEGYVRLAAQVRHQHILPIHSLHQGRETPVLLSQDPTDHESLAHVLARRRVLAPPHAVAVIRQIALACEEASRHGVVHGWLRPDIILLNAESQAMVDEFGILKHHRFLVRELSGASAATEYYLAPEHLGDDVRSDARTDMFLLGALLFRMITGEGLVTGYTAHEALHKVSATGCRSVRSVQPQASRDLDAFVSQLTAIDRKDRPQAWSDVIETCDRFGGGARRQTFRVTQPIEQPIGNAGGTRSHTRTAAHTNTNTAALRRGTGGAGTVVVRRDPQSGIRSGPGHRSRNADGGSNGVLIMIVVLVLVGGAAAVIYAFNKSNRAAAASQRETPPTNPATTTTTTPAAKPEPTPTRLPGFMGGGPTTTTTTTTTTTPPPATTATAPTANPVPIVQPGDQAYTDLMLKIADAERGTRFREALTLCERLPVDARQARVAEVVAQHLARREAVAQRVRQSASLEEARGHLETALKLWNMPGDAEWAQQTMQQAGAEAPAAPANKTAPAPAPAPTAPPTSAKPGESPAEIAWTVETLLAKHQIIPAEQAAAPLTAGTPEASAVRRRIELWRNRAEILNAGLTARKPVARLVNPADGQQWDVTGVEEAGLSVTSTSGSSTRWDWNQVSAKDAALIALVVADSANPPDPRASALAVVMLCAAGDTALATVQLKRAKSVMTADLVTDLETSLALHRQFENIDLLRRAEEAAKSGNAKLLSDLMDQAKRGDRAKDPDIAAALPRLEDALKRLQSGQAGDNAAPLRDRLLFDVASDLDSLPIREGEWAVQGGQLIANGTSGAVGRKDLATGKSMTLIFQTGANRGALNVNFRGIRVLIDLSKGSISASTRDQELKPQDLQVTPRTACTLYIELRGTQALVELNNGVVSLDLKSGKPTDQLAIGFDTGAALMFDELSITRETKLDAAAEAQRIAAIRALGFEPIGQATLVPPSIVLPNSTPRSGIAFARRDGIASLTFEAKGRGRIEVRLGKLGEGGGQAVNLDLGKDADTPVRYTVSWTGGVLQVRKGDPTGDVIVEDRLQGDPPHVMLIAQQEATFVSTPRLNRQ